MESDYDQKFEEMKKYIPFLESMIKRLETTSTSSANPRQAQLDKIRSLRDLLLDKKKRMKMDNLLKCEQVLVNLYAKVEQKDTLPDIKKVSEPSFSSSSSGVRKSNLDTARNKLKSVVAAVTKVPKEEPDTLPEIARASETEVVCVPGSKEPALFQRRPNKASKSPERTNSKSPQKSVAKRQYTRVLVSPESSTRRWSTSEDPLSNKPLFSRRSPRRSPKINSPAYKKEKKKSSKLNKVKAQDLNITLNVPEELNTEGDILSRIIQCPDNDVDIATLRDLKRRILSELKQTGASDDISDLILKSYKNKKKKAIKKRDEIEEGELSDSESEAIQSIYGSLVVVDKDKNKSGHTNKTSVDAEKEQRKIQICLVINSDKDDPDQNQKGSKPTEITDFEMFDDIGVKGNSGNQRSTDETVAKCQEPNSKTKMNILNNSDDLITIDVEEEDLIKNDSKVDSRDTDSSYIDISSSDDELETPKKVNYTKENNVAKDTSIAKDINSTKDNNVAVDKNVDKDDIIDKDKNVDKDNNIDKDNNVPKDDDAQKVDVPHQANFYKPIKHNNDKSKICEEISIPEESSHGELPQNDKNKTCAIQKLISAVSPESTDKNVKPSKVNENASKQSVSSTTEQLPQNKEVVPDKQQKPENKEGNDVEIPLLNTDSIVTEPRKKETVSEIDILQALKNEILSETIAIPGADVATPPLHQPKVTKVASAQEIVKKRISIEKYKEKTVSQQNPSSLFIKKPLTKSKDSIKKTSLKLTEEEQQRFNFLPLALDDSSDDEDQDQTVYSAEDIYGDLAPKSPENMDKDTSGASPIIIPAEPVKPPTASSNADVDMRTLVPLMSLNVPKPMLPKTLPSPRNILPETENQKVLKVKRPLLDTPPLDPRVRRDFGNSVIKNSPNPHQGLNPDRTPRQTPFFSNMTPSMTPNPRSFEMTPSHQPNLEIDDGFKQKHVYAPFPTFDSRDNREHVINNDSQESRWDTDLKDSNISKKYEERDHRNRYSQDYTSDYLKPRHESDKYYRDLRKDRYEQRDDYSRLDCPRTPVHPFGRDCPATPTPSFGRIDTPVNAYSRADCPTTPIHPFGRSDRPTTPSDPFARSDCPTTPIHHFGRSDHPMTPSHPFGRPDVPTTPSHLFGRSDAPMTPSHPFGRLDAPMTPSHQFGRSDAPMTPSHQFGRSEAPMTPNHPFGRSDVGIAPTTPSHPFGRNEHLQNQHTSGTKIKDPRLNRGLDNDLRRNEENRDQSYYKDRKSELSHKSYNYSDSYRSYREQNRSGKNDRAGHQYRERTPGREPSIGRGISKDYENDRLYTRDRGNSNDYSRDFDIGPKRDFDIGSRREYHPLGQSVGRSGPSEERPQRALSRPRTDDENHRKLETDNTLSVKPQSGRSFTIDTSVNTTFQEFLNGKGLQIFDYSFDDRKKRATSVGRTLKRVDVCESSVRQYVREGSVGRSLPKTNIQEDTSGYKRMVNFVRAKSMGREIADSKAAKSFKEIKADFKSYQDSYKAREKHLDVSNRDKQINSDPRSRRDQFEKIHGLGKKTSPQKITKKTSPQKITSYSPRKNCRDPRMNRGHTDKNKRYEDKKKNYGIVYSSDNIAKGTILGSGYGVKNYKIPKIKRPVEEMREEQKIEKKPADGGNKTQLQDGKHKDKKETKSKIIPLKGKNEVKKGKDTKPVADKKKEKLENQKESAYKLKEKQNETIKKRTPRPTRLSDNLFDGESIIKTKKTKKAIIDSDSDSETTSQSQTLQSSAKEDNRNDPKEDSKNEPKEDNRNEPTEDIRNETKEIKPKDVASQINTELIETQEDSIFDSSFGMDDVFPESIATDPVLSNLNDLIADLDKEIGSSKDDFTKDTIFDSLLENINSPEGVNETFNDVSDVIKQDLISVIVEPNKSENLESESATELPVEDKFQQSLQSVKETQSKDGEIPCKDRAIITEINKNEKQETYADLNDCHGHDINESKIGESENSEAIVSTTEIEKESVEKIEKDPTQEGLEVNKDRSSTPDSTIHINESQKVLDETVGLPDSTALKTDFNSDVSSSHDQSDTINVGTYPQKEKASESIGNLLSILQDKTKIKELLSMLGDQSGENDKIKKKLEKLSEIVSDDEDDDSAKEINNAIAKEPVSADDNQSDNVSEKDSEILQQKVNDEESLDPNNEDKHDTNKIEKQGQEINYKTKDQTNLKDQTIKPRKGPGRKRKVKLAPPKSKRLTRSAANLGSGNAKKPSRELRLLRESIKEMFMKDEDDILNATGIRMCRLAKMVDEKSLNQNLETAAQSMEPKPVVVLEKFKDIEKGAKDEKTKKTPGVKPKTKLAFEEKLHIDNDKYTGKTDNVPKYKPGPKSKKKSIYEEPELDPYSFDDSISETTSNRISDQENESGSENESLASSKSFGSSEILAEVKKKPKRKRRYKWNSGIISSNKRRKKLEPKQIEEAVEEHSPVQKQVAVPDMNCFTDKTYCFLKSVHVYSCRLCDYSGNRIVKHYKTEHPHSEIPLSRMHAVLAREAIEQCGDINFKTISKIPTEKFVCRFCYEEFGNKKTNLEEFFWHVVSVHTGEYKQLCSECVNVTRCPFNLDIPPPPKDPQGLLIGYICGKCYFTQISLENLKMHVIVRHNDEQTAVYTINLAVMSKKTMKALMKHASHNEETRVLRSSRSNPSVTEISDDFADDTDGDSITDSLKLSPNETKPSKVSVQSKLTFEPDENISDSNSVEVKVKKEGDELDVRDNILERSDTKLSMNLNSDQLSSDIFNYPHFKVYFSDTGTKEYVCCINGKDNHYKTTLFISMKKHVQTKHSEVWDGYCFVCKVIVMPQGKYSFKDCLQHMVDNHSDNFPVLTQTVTETQDTETQVIHEIVNNLVSDDGTDSQKPYISVRPLSDLITTDTSTDNSEALPKIQSVVSLGTTIVNSPKSSPTLFNSPATIEKLTPKPEEPYKYEEMQTEVMSKKHRVILDAMLSEEKLVQIYKCAGVYCAFTTDSADAAVLHASTHQRIGGENGLVCAYCDFDCKGNAIDLVMHVFKIHGRCRFSCGRCFYRAVASQLVLAHMLRVHGSTVKKILETTTVTPVGDDSEDILPRDIAVQHYVCADMEKSCKFRTYTQGKFIEHLQKHNAPYICSICLNASDNPTELLQHLKTHGLKLYQCTWCLSGCDNEAEFLEHSSSRHPTRQPQAYLRVITNNTKGGTSRTMVLPLVKLNKSSVPTQLVTSNCKVDDPVREAERALDLEKIITSMSLFSNDKEIPASASSLSTPQMPEPSPAVTEESLNVISKEGEVTLQLTEPCIDKPPTLTPVMEQINQNPALEITPILKIEPVDVTPQAKTVDSSIICLDSDEDDATDPPQNKEESTIQQNVIDLSADDNILTESPVTKKVHTSLLYKCGNCDFVFKRASGFKLHLKSCFQPSQSFKCAHCTFTTNQLEVIYSHYTTDHQLNHSYVCDVCGRNEKSMYLCKTHLKKDHNITSFTVTTKEVKERTIYVVSDATKYPTKRKLSVGPTTENLPKRIRYGAQDLHKLPQKPILDHLAYCSECEFNTKVRGNLVRHIQLHAENQLVPETAPVNPVPHLETNEKHFDKMVNLASSSLELARAEKSSPSVTLHIPPEVASRYPKYVPERQRHTCGAKGCSYISVDDAMLKCHWETLHSDSTDFHCAHCPPYQYLDTSKPLTSARIIAHLKMHDIRLYACSSCTYYHYRKQVLDKHVVDQHKGAAQVMIVREEFTGQTPVTLQSSTSTAPTMDLKPWKCGLCSYHSMLRPEVVEHCSKKHNSKMQFKCPVCPFRTSVIENVKKHQALSHPENTEDIFYYYYREGSIPDEADGTPRWVKQRQKCGNPDPEPEVKTETVDNTTTSQASLQSILFSPPSELESLLNPTPAVNLNLVKKELPDPDTEESMDTLCALYGEICDPNGLKYKCPLCKFVTEDNKDAMQSHLFEELQYRRWGCNICSYKAFHKTGLNEHMITEHRQIRAIEPKEQPVDTKIERWVNKVLEHQTFIIERNKNNLVKQKIQGERSNVVPTSKPTEKLGTSRAITEKLSDSDIQNLKQSFGQFGVPNGSKFCCPKCEFQHSDENIISDHLESELNMIRWRCSACLLNVQHYHEAQLHVKTCKVSQPGQTTRVIEAIRDPGVRSSWLAAVIRTQKEAMNDKPETIDEDILKGPLENSLLVVRYEEKVPTPEDEMMNRKKKLSTAAATVASPDSDDERLIIDEVSTDDAETPKKKEVMKKCSYCPFTTKYQQALDHHILRHYNLRPFTCGYCELTFYRCLNHTQVAHPGMPERFFKTKVPTGPPLTYDLTVRGKKRRSGSSDEPARKEKMPLKQKDETKKDDISKLICLTCEKPFTEIESLSHTHDKHTYFAKKGDVVVKCCVCLYLFPNINIMQEHNIESHSNTPINYAFFKLQHDKREIHQCGHCNKRFKFFRDLKVHHNTLHSSLQLKYESKPYCPGMYDVECENEELVETSKIATDDVIVLSEEKAPTKRVAKKSTTKLPNQTVAKKSTTKLPFFYTEESESEDEFSYYGTKPTSFSELENVTTMMPFCNTVMPFSVKKLSEIIKIDPRIVVKDCEK